MLGMVLGMFLHYHLTSLCCKPIKLTLLLTHFRDKDTETEVKSGPDSKTHAFLDSFRCPSTTQI